MRIFFLLFLCHLFGDAVETFYGKLEVEEPVLLELIDSPAMQRLKGLHQYGISYYVTHGEEYNRFDHSMGVFALLRRQGASLEEQIAGLLHDASHTAFSHVGDFLFQSEDAYQDEIHEWYLNESSIGKILAKYDLQTADVLPKTGRFLALEQSLPELCADRIDYNIQGAFYRGFLTKEEAIALADDLQFIEGEWVANRSDLVEKMARFALFMCQDCWGSAENYFISNWFSEAIHRGVEIGLIQKEEIHFGVDDDLWRRMKESADPVIQDRFEKIFQFDERIEVNPKDPERYIKTKFRGVDPWVLVEGKKRRLTDVSASYAQEFFQVQNKMRVGWPIRIKK